jgi:hypothetical protein
MALADVCGLKTNQLKNGFLSDFGGTSTNLLDDALTATNSFTIPYGIDVREHKAHQNKMLFCVSIQHSFRISSTLINL